MTKDDAVLDPEIFLKNSPITLHRIARDKYADLSGIGAARSPGRWNKAGQEAIYTSLNSSTAQLEVLGHTPKDFVPVNLVRMRIEFKGNWKQSRSGLSVLGIPIDPKQNWLVTDSATGASLLIARSLAAARIVLPYATIGMETVGAAVPSVHDEQWNVILFPQCGLFTQHVALGIVEPFAFDERLFPMTALKGK